MLTLNAPYLYSYSDNKSKELYPDVFQYRFTQEEYQYYWNNIQQQKGFLKADGFYLSRVSWYQYAWQTFKGWLGFTNYCDSKRVQMLLKKTLYAGYLFDFNQSINLTGEMSALVPNTYLDCSKKARSNEHSLFLQNELTAAYNCNFSANNGYRFFGQSYCLKSNVVNGNIDILTTIDPQLMNNLPRLLSGFSIEDYKYILSRTIPSSDLCRQIACEMITQAQTKYFDGFERVAFYAKSVCPEIELIYLNRFIALYGHNREYSDFYRLLDKLSDEAAISALTQYFLRANEPTVIPLLQTNKTRFDKWLTKLYELVSHNRLINPDDKKLAMRWVLTYKPDLIEKSCYATWFSFINQDSSLSDRLKKDSDLAISYATSLHTQVFWFFRPDLKKINHQKIAMLSTELAIKNDDIATLYFEQLLNEHKYEEAWGFYTLRKKKCPQGIWDNTQLEKLAQWLENESEHLFVNELSSDNETMEPFYRKGIQILIDAIAIEDTASRRFNLNTKCRQLINLLLGSELDNRIFSQSQLSEINEFFLLIKDNSCQSIDDKLESLKIRFDERCEKNSPLYNFIC